MGVKDVGIGKIVEDMVDLVTVGIVSTTSNTPDPTDTTIPDQIAATELSLTDITASNKTFTAKHFINSGTGNGNTFRTPILETADGTLFSSELHPDLAKTNTDEVAYFHKIVINQAK